MKKNVDYYVSVLKTSSNWHSARRATTETMRCDCGAHSWECLLPAKQCKRDQNSLAVCSSFIKRRHFACITSAAPRTLFSEAALAASGIRVCKSIARPHHQRRRHRLYRNSRVCEHTSFSHVCVWFGRVCVCVFVYVDMTWVFGLITHIMLGRARRSPHACHASVVCGAAGAWQCCSAHIKEPSPPGPVTPHPCRPLAFAQGHTQNFTNQFSWHNLYYESRSRAYIGCSWFSI
jgi:hypothetical protein